MARRARYRHRFRRPRPEAVATLRAPSPEPRAGQRRMRADPGLTCRPPATPIRRRRRRRRPTCDLWRMPNRPDTLGRRPRRARERTRRRECGGCHRAGQRADHTGDAAVVVRFDDQIEIEVLQRSASLQCPQEASVAARPLGSPLGLRRYAVSAALTWLPGVVRPTAWHSSLSGHAEPGKRRRPGPVEPEGGRPVTKGSGDVAVGTGPSP